MTARTTAAAASALLTCAVVATVAFALAEPRPAAEVTQPARAVVLTELPGLSAAAGEPSLPGLADAAPAGDAVVGRVPGPFDSRFTLADDGFDGRSVRGTLTVTSDVSEILELEVLAGFYDGSGTLLGSAMWVAPDAGDHGAEAAPSDIAVPTDTAVPTEAVAFDVEVPAELRGKAVTAAVGVPILVNE